MNNVRVQPEGHAIDPSSREVDGEEMKENCNIIGNIHDIQEDVEPEEQK